jgi:hypothetical protein
MLILLTGYDRLSQMAARLFLVCASAIPLSAPAARGSDIKQRGQIK